MTRKQFLNDLYRRLGALPREEAEQHLTYYAEMLADRMEEGMTEDEAVAAMEDVDTIARRILEDAGADQERGFEQPLGTEQVDKPRKRRVKPLVILIAAVLVLPMLLTALMLALFMLNTDVSDARHEILDGQNSVTIDMGTGDIISAVSKPDREEPTDSIGDHVVDTVDGTYTVVGDGIRNIRIEWVNGAVLIEAGEGSDIVFTESSTGELKDAEKLTYTLRNGELTIKFAQQGLKNVSKTKHLTVQLPAGLTVNELEVDTVSAPVEIRDVTAVELDLETTSGDVLASGSFGKVSAESISGELTLAGRITSVEVESTSGNVIVEEEGTLAKLDVETVSGDVELSLPSVAAFDLHYETASGDLDSEGFGMQQSSGDSYSVGGGGNRFEVETVSGDLTLKSK